MPFFPFKRIKSTKPTNNQPDNCQLCRFICSLKKLSEKRSYYSDTPGKFVLLKELKRKFLQIFFVDNFYFCSFVAENERFNQRLNQGFASKEAESIYDEVFYFTDEKSIQLPENELIAELKESNPDWFE